MCRNFPLSKFTTIKLGGESKVDFLYEKKDLIKLREKPLIVGGGSNLLVSDKGVNYAVINRLYGTVETADGFIVNSGERISTICALAKSRGLGGLEWACGIPATVGGAIASNAGAYGNQMSDIVEWVEVYRDGKTQLIANCECGFSYRRCNLDGFITQAKIKLYAQEKEQIEKNEKKFRTLRALAQPKGYSAGSIFKQADRPAWEYVEKVGLKGARIGGAFISEKHANFIINDGTATASQVYELILLVQKTVKKQFGINLEREIKLYGEF